MTPKTINTFISSANRENNKPVHKFTVDFTDDLIKCRNDQYICVNVISFDMINAMYNIKNQKFEFKIRKDSDVVLRHRIINIPDGNYSVFSFKKYLEENVFNVVFNDTVLFEIALQSYFSLSHNTAQNTFTFKRKILSGDFVNYVFAIKCSVLGFKELTDLLFQGVSGSYVNLTNYNKVILRTDSLNYDASCIENVRYNNIANKLRFSNILFWCSKQDTEPFRNIFYNSSDGGNSFNDMLHDKFVNQMNLQLTNELGNYITDAPDYLLVLQFSIHNKEEWFKKTLLQIAKNIKQIFVLILWIAENYLQII